VVPELLSAMGMDGGPLSTGLIKVKWAERPHQLVIGDGGTDERPHCVGHFPSGVLAQLSPRGGARAYGPPPALPLGQHH